METLIQAFKNLGFFEMLIFTIRTDLIFFGKYWYVWLIIAVIFSGVRIILYRIGE